MNVIKSDIGAVFLIPLLNGELMPFQIVGKVQKGMLTTCALVGLTYSNDADARSAAAQWSARDVVATITVPTTNIGDHDGAAWKGIGVLPVLWEEPAVGRRLKMAAAIREKLGLQDQGVRFSSVGVMRALANACAGARPWDSMAQSDYFEQFLINPRSSLVRRRFS